MTPRLPPVPYEEWDFEALSIIMPPGRKPPPSNMLGMFAHHPRLAKAFLRYNNHLLFRSSLPARDKELAILRVAWRRRCRYEWAQHVIFAREAGVTDEELAGIRTGADTLINRAVDELEEAGALSEATYAELAEGYDTHQLLDFVFTVGTYGLLAMACTTFGVELDPGIPDENFDSPD
ncbi:alkylhydroperoxidase AhpD family core domain-containing protein [Thermomonospora echinospora]|uniref:Alkylhydroperoxidase AhpD family core domain-containing protein n=1 Tax=Thermomonospora echinospora TaxID=1992 RepID=A0A1H6DJ30_9ACTN|nr:carboxymuconolactone decarboxylase family protein [Thermomonospora echinospora]SEG85159.1 alkylhydroperoxidase AhpD family core domain-containing protein [Thermomonospora echinospora]